MEVVKSLRPGDIIRARVISLGDSTQYFLSTAENELGVRWAKSAAGAIMIPISWQVRENALATLRRRPFHFFLWCVLAHLAVVLSTRWATVYLLFAELLPMYGQGPGAVPALWFGTAGAQQRKKEHNGVLFCGQGGGGGFAPQ